MIFCNKKKLGKDSILFLKYYMLCFEKMVISLKFLYFARLEGAGVRREIKCLRRMGKRGFRGDGGCGDGEQNVK